MRDLIAKRRAGDKDYDDVTSVLMNAQIEGETLGEDELLNVFKLMMTAGLGTVQSVLAQSIVYFARNPEQWDAMFEDPALLDAAIEELLRVSSPAVPTRTVTDDSVVVGDLELPKGERVHMPLAAANRDPKYYPDPDRVDFRRPAKPHLSFGLGPHRCLGVHLARLELRVGLTELHRRLPHFELAPGTTPTEHVGLAWAMENVHLRFEPGRRESNG
jgi:cytochrome P450